jgi:outer membrane protein assembly factor BamB
MQRFAYAFLSCCLAVGVASAEDWPQWLGPKGDGVWRETGLLDKFPPEGPKVRWRTPVGIGYAGPAVADGRVYLLDRVLAEGARNPDNPFSRDLTVGGKELVRCFDAATGKPLWEHSYDCEYQVSYPAGPRTTPTVHGGKVYTLGTMGDLYCLDAATGKVVWSRNLPQDYKVNVPMWGFAGHPLVDGDRVICLVGAANGAVVAFHKDTGKEIWKSVSAPRNVHGPGYCPASLVEIGGRRQLIVWLPESVHSLNPETGVPYWSEKFHVEAGMTIPVPRQSGDKLYFTCFYSGSMMLQLAADRPAETVLWKSKTWGARSGKEFPDKTDSLHCVMSTPIFRDGYIYGICSHGELRCINAATGERVWESLQATGTQKNPAKDRWDNAFLVAQGEGDRFVLFNEHGELILARMTPKGYEEISRARILEPTNRMAQGKRPVVWSHPAFANLCVYARNDKELICVSLAAGDAKGE